MNFIRELSLIFTKQKLLGLKKKRPPFAPDSKMERLYYGIIDGEFHTDEEAFQNLYPDKDQFQNYRNLKSRLHKHLIDLLLTVTHDADTDLQKAYYQCQKDWTAVKILIGQNARRNAIRIAEKLLGSSQQYDFTDISCSVCEILRTHYCIWEGDAKKFEHYNQLYKYYEQLSSAEAKAEELYLTLIIKYVKKKSDEQEVREKAEAFYKELQPFLPEYKSYRFLFNTYLIQLVIYTSTYDYENAAKVCEEAIHAFRAKSYTASTPLKSFYYQQLIAYLQLQEFEKGEQAAIYCLSFMKEGSFNWFEYQKSYIQLCLHTEQYQKAYSLFLDTVHKGWFDHIPESVAENWKIYEAYLYYLISIRKIRKQKNDTHFTKFWLGKFMNETLLYSKDKRGMNIAILIIQLLFLLHEQEYDKIIDRRDAITLYCYRYLNQEDTYRSNCFIKMLLQLSESGFQESVLNDKAKNYLEELQAVPLKAAKQNHEIEIIPYEKLWEMALQTVGVVDSST